MTPDLTVATITLARSPAEAENLLGALTRLAHHGLPIVAADGGSLATFRERAGALPGVTLLATEPGSGPRLLSQVRLAVTTAAATGRRLVLYTEPDKHAFFERSLAALVTAALEDADAVTLAARDPDSFSTFPAGQRLTESLMNRLAGEALGGDGDYTYGPLVTPARLASCLDEIRGDVGWGWRFFLLARAHRLGLPVRRHVGDFPCPPDQRGEDGPAARVYRMEQLSQNVAGLAQGLKGPADVPPV